ncbi:P2Y purinoceptor 13 [Dunckerocampus dactyliophorus]|uniref:P2Y purinoceptor 13 n=1 Tax=Dunckerocampus dactyliophorus TaxID=161453 RepID=UPI0024060A85|nr:P2Y purinoceptor 13 [Dunckerocampus dactyliophorus]XP_054651271.1 P2Y purinoceptor 13 [Dunckerocampus dactyliophorus]XP_054651273.1 P2Y purinoceptor 13 [Dunckerocampus dactyliophorus]XP_054651274.1 P2Y purinoceptor 13 [Dunckerocampus dactyliophorus]
MNTSLTNASSCVWSTNVNEVVLPWLYSVVFIVSLAMNSVAAWIFFSIPSTSTFVVFLKNVVVADLLMTFTMPLKILSDFGLGPSHLRAIYCRYSAVIFYMTMYISIVLLGLISLDRYLKIVRPFGKGTLQRVRVAQVISVVVWIIMWFSVFPNIILSNQPPRYSKGRVKCASMKSKLGLQWHEGLGYFCQLVFWGTLALMVFCYTFISRTVYNSYKASKSSSPEASRRTKAKVFVVVVVFFICYAPYHFVRVPYTLSQTRNLSQPTCWAQKALYITKQVTLWMSASNVCLDPLIYVFLCKMFRKRLTATISRKPPHKVESPTVTSTQL